MSRSVWKGFFVDLSLIKKFDELLLRALDEFCLENNIVDITDADIKTNRQEILDFARKLSRRQPLEVWSRRSTVLPEFVGFSFSIYNGRNFKVVKIKEKMSLNKFGEFAFTKRLGADIHSDKKAKKDKKK